MKRSLLALLLLSGCSPSCFFADTNNQTDCAIVRFTIPI